MAHIHNSQQNQSFLYFLLYFLFCNIFLLPFSAETDANKRSAVQEKNEEFQLLLEGLNGPSFQDLESKVEWSGKLIANYCIANKLKTSFGKAQETLGAYERTMRTLANNFGKQTAPLQPQKIRQARNFLVIFDCLEKAMYQVSSIF